MTEYHIQPHSRRCTITGRELKPGERFFTALVEEGPTLVRQDYSLEAWQGPPPNVFSFWTGKVPESQEKLKPRFDDDLLEECFQRLENQTEPAKVNFRYVVALLLLRRKRLKFEQTVADGPVEKIIATHVRTGEKYQVINPRLTDEEMLTVQEEVFKVLGWN